MDKDCEEFNEFIPCALFFEGMGCTELLTKDTAIVWVHGNHFDLGYDFDGALVAVRLPGDVTKRPMSASQQ